MKDRIYIYTNSPLQNFIKEALFEFDVHMLDSDFFNTNNFINNNVLFMINEDIKISINQTFFSKNNVIVFFSKKEKILI